MVYEPLHHKYRPQTFADLVGQEAISATLSNALISGRIAPAYLFTGPRGTGKTSSARILAKSLNCLQFEQPTPQPCGQCEVCQAIARGSALDVIEIDAASNTGVDNIREIIERAQFAPVQCRYKVYVIDECHMLSQAAFNALLKTLEEPPERVIFVLATTDPQRVLPTIISRCQRFDYRRIPLASMVNHLTYIAQQETIEIDVAALTLVGQLANGGLRDAESLLDQLSLLPGAITPHRVWELVGAVPERELLELLQAIRANQAPVVIEQCRQLLDRGREPLVVLQNLAGAYLNLLLAKTAPSRPDLVAVTESTWIALCQEAQHWSNQDILRGQQHLRDSEVQLKNTTQPRLWLEIILMGLLTHNQSPGEMSGAVTTQVTIAPPPMTRLPSTISAPTATQPTTTPQSKKAVQSDNGIINPVPSTVNSSSGKQALEHIVSPQPELGTNPEPKVPPAIANDHQPIAATEISTFISPDATATISTVETPNLPEIWEKVLDTVSPLTKALMRPHCHLLSVDEAVALIGIRSEPLLKIAQTKQSELEEAVKKVLNRSISVRIQVSSAINSENIPSTQEETHNSKPKANNEHQIIPASKLDQTEEISPSPSLTVSKEASPIKPSIPEKMTRAENNQIVNGLNPEANFHEAIDKEVSPTSNRNGDDTPALVNEAAAKIAKLFSGEIIPMETTQDKITADSDSKTETHNNLNSGSTTTENNEYELAESNKDFENGSPQTIIRGRPTLSEIDDTEDIPF